jgi:hypothetical protein
MRPSCTMKPSIEEEATTNVSASIKGCIQAIRNVLFDYISSFCTDGAYTYNYRSRYIGNYAGSYGGGVSPWD